MSAPSERRDRGVSQTVAFVLVFSLIVTSIGLVATAGFDSIRDVQRIQQAESSTELMRAAGTGIGQVATGERPSYRSSLPLSGGTVAVTDETTIDVTVTSATGTAFSATYRPGGIQYRADGRNVTYQSGVLARSGAGRGTVSLSSTMFRCEPSRGYSAVTVIRLRNDGLTATGGEGVTVRATSVRDRPPATRSGLDYPTGTPHEPVTELELTVDGPYESAWRDALADRGFTDAGSGTFTCSASRAFVHAPQVNVTLS